MKKKSNKINFKSNSSRAIYNYVLENNYKITVKQACDELAVTPSQVYSLIGLLRKKGMNVRVIRKSVERQIYREARQYIEEHNCEISIAKACRDLNVSREQLNNMIHKFRKNGMQISIIQASDIIKLPLNKNTEEAVYQYIVDHNYSISSRQMRTDLSLTKQQTKSFLQKFRRKGIIIQFLIGVLTPIILIGGIIAVLNELIQSFEKKEEYNRKLEELEEEIKEFSSQNQTLVEDCKSTIREIELEHQKTIQSLSRCSQSLYNEANAVLKNTHDLMIINGLLSERIQTLLKYATTSLEPEQESKLIEEITSAINHIKMENEQIAHHRQELEKAMRDIEQHDLEVAQKQELKEIQGHHFGGLSI